MPAFCGEPNGMARLQLEVQEEADMARYKVIDTSPRFIAVDLQRQLVPGTFEHALNYLIDHEIDLSGFDGRCADEFNITFRTR